MSKYLQPFKKGNKPKELNFKRRDFPGLAIKLFAVSCSIWGRKVKLMLKCQA
jgi:hypothetical protein